MYVNYGKSGKLQDIVKSIPLTPIHISSKFILKTMFKTIIDDEIAAGRFTKSTLRSNARTFHNKLKPLITQYSSYSYTRNDRNRLIKEFSLYSNDGSVVKIPIGQGNDLKIDTASGITIGSSP